MPRARFTSRTDGPTLLIPTDAFGPSAPIFRLSCSRLTINRQNSGGPSLAADGTLIVADRQGVFAVPRNHLNPYSNPDNYTNRDTDSYRHSYPHGDTEAYSDTETNPDAEAAPDTGASPVVCRGVGSD